MRKEGKEMKMFENIDFNGLIEKASKNKCEITVSCEPTRTEITIQPWKPFEYSCPYKDGNTLKRPIESGENN